jgi:hypothetical protein
MSKFLGSKIKPEVLLAELDDLLRIKPSIAEIADYSDAVLGWRGRASAVIHAWDSAQAIRLGMVEIKLNSTFTQDNEDGYRRLIALLMHARHALRLATVGPLSVAVGQGMHFDYFDELRKIVERATSDLFFADPYLDADFVSRYLAFSPKDVPVRLLTREKLKTLLPAVDAFVAQYGSKIEVRSKDGTHDRYVFVDGKECYQSGASFKDGARNAPTTLTQITDAFAAMSQTYEAIWAGAQVHRS